MKADTGATANYIRTKDAVILSGLKSTSTGPHVRLPNNAIITSKLEGTLPIPNVPLAATKAHTFDDQLCDADCSALFTRESLKVYNRSKDLVLTGQRNQNDGLWDVNLSSLKSAPPVSLPMYTTASLNAVLRYDKTKSELAAYLHAAAGYPTKSSFITAIKNGNFLTWPGLTPELISKHLLPSIPTTKGHLKQEQQNLRSTRSPDPLPSRLNP